GAARRSAWRRIKRRARHRRTVVIAGSSRATAPSDAATRRQIWGHRACHVARGAKRSGVSVPPAHDGECETRPGPGHAPQRLGGCRSRLARQGNQSAPAWLEPASPYYSVAPQTGARHRSQRPKRPCPTVAELWRSRSGQGTVGIRCAGDVAEARNPDPGSVVSRPGRLRDVFDELKNQWGWGGFTTQDLHRCRLVAGTVALVYNWWNLFTRLADPEHHREALTSRPLLLSAVARQTQHAGQVT